MDHHQVAFYNMQGEGCLLLPRSSIFTLLLEFRPEAEHTFAPFCGDYGCGGDSTVKIVAGRISYIMSPRMVDY